MKKVVYHGSENPNLEEIKSHKSTHQKDCIYASENKVVAMLFMGHGNGDLDTVISSNDGKLELTERREGVLETLYNKDGYIYLLDASTFKHYNYLWSMEVISFEKSIKPIDKIYYPNILDALNLEEQNGNIKIYRYPNKPKYVAKDNSDLIDKYISFEKKGLTGAVDDLLKIYPEFKDEVYKRLK